MKLNKFLIFTALTLTNLIIFKVQVQAETMPIEESVMVTIEENFGSDVTSIEQALSKIERRYDPADGTGRTFAILDAYGNKMPDGRYHISMHISSEKTGRGRLILKPTSKVLWDCTITPKEGRTVAADKKLTIYIERENEKDKFYTIDGSGNPATIFDCKLDETKKPLTDYWKDGVTKEFIFIYSACGCPVHVRFMRSGRKSVFKSGDNVIFPDDPGLVSVLHRLMAY